ncbi:MAG: sigma-70 family RNA polymerase sigma factor [Prevotella sp.]|nr:sigma-70 family RNA polymerase sigma factor [Prevotella sp.]
MEIVRLIERCRQGDGEALGELYEAYAHRMRGVCRRYINDKQTVEDVVHDAFVIIFTSFDRLRDPRRAEPWMMAIVRNVASKCKDHLDALPTVPLEETDRAELLDAEDDGASLLAKENDVRGVPLSEVIGLIDKLPEGYGQVFRLSVFEGMTHKEIADVLDIEPHSSSSQLSRAKKMLRKMMQQYWAMVLLLFVPLAFYLFKKAFDSEHPSSPATIEKKPIVAKPKSKPNSQPGISPTRQSHNPVIVPLTVPHTTIPVADTLQSTIAQAADSVMTDTLSNMTAQEHIISDTIKSEEQTDTTQTLRKMEMPHHEITNRISERTTTNHTPKWSLELAYSGQLDKWNNYNQPYTYEPKPLPGQSDPGTSPTIPSSIDNWSDYAVYLANNPDAASEQTRSVIMRIALSNANRPGEDKILRTSHHQMPVTWSLALKYKLNHRWGLETGLNYSKLTSEFEMGEDGNKIEQRQTIHYLGIPVKGLFNIYGGKACGLYGSAGLVTEIPVHAPLYSNYYMHGLYEASDKTTIRAPWQFSTTFGLGIQYHLTPGIGIFAEPGLQYFIPTHTDIETYRTEHPFTFSLPIGIRFTW